MIKLLLIFAGGGLGSISRYGVSGLALKAGGNNFPYGTLAVNLIGALIIGFLFEYAQIRYMPEKMRLFLLTGFLGGFTTFSTYSLESINLMRNKQSILALLNIGISNIGCLFFVFAGVLIFRAIYNS